MPPSATAVAATKSRIHEAAISLFTKKGFHGTGIREIADRAGVSVGNLYNHHRNKQELFAAIMADFEAAYTALDTPLARAFTGFRSFDDLEAVGAASREMVGRFSDYIRLIYVDVVELGGEHIRRLFGGMRDRYEATFGDRLAELERAGGATEGKGVPALMTATILFFYLFNVEHLFGVPKLLGVPDDEAIRLISGIVRKGVEPR